MENLVSLNSTRKILTFTAQWVWRSIIDYGMVQGLKWISVPLIVV